MMPRAARRIIAGLAVTTGLIGLWLAWAAITYSPTYVYRVLQMRESDQTDYLENFPLRTLAASSRPYHYVEAPDPDLQLDLAAAFGVEDLDDFLARSETQALIVIDNNRVSFERYANGADRATMLTSFSVAKSFVSVLIGIAADEGLLSVHDPIAAHLPELASKDPDLSQITIGHLLSMSSGLAYQETRWALFNGDDALTTYHPDQRAVSLKAATRLTDTPGEFFRYNKYHPQLLGMILERVTDMSVTEYTRSRLWEPLGMAYDGQWTLDSDDSGFEKLEAGLNARAIDFAKLGSVLLEGGEWNGSRIVSREWIRESTSPDADRDTPSHYRDDDGQWIYADGGGWYGYFWYGLARADADSDFFAEGDHGQFIYVSPSANRVMVRMGSEYGLPKANWIDAFYRLCSNLTF